MPISRLPEHAHGSRLYGKYSTRTDHNCSQVLVRDRLTHKTTLISVGRG